MVLLHLQAVNNVEKIIGPALVGKVRYFIQKETIVEPG
jgi:hypothetical protein